MDITLYKEEYTPNFWPAFIVVPLMAPLFWKYHVAITEDAISFGYSSFVTSKRVTHRTKTIREATPLFDQKWFNFGIHYKPDANNFFGRWERQYIANNGGAVKLVVADDNDNDNDDTGGANTTTFFFSAKDPKKICDILNKAI